MSNKTDQQDKEEEEIANVKEMEEEDTKEMENLEEDQATLLFPERWHGKLKELHNINRLEYTLFILPD